MTILQIQQKLRAMGFNPGPLDGKHGPKTTAALKDFQASRGLTADGQVREQTVAALAGALADEQDSPSVFIDVGHGKRPEGFDPGAVHASSKTTEHSLNGICANAMAEALRGFGIEAKVDDAGRGLYADGAAARGYDMLVSVHHNAAGARAQYATTRFHSKKAGSGDKKAATMIATAMAKALGIPDKGALPMALGVLSGAKDAGVKTAFLIEPYFMHQQSPDNPPAKAMPDWSKRAGVAVAGAIAGYFGVTK